MIGRAECTLENHVAPFRYQDLAGKLLLLVKSHHELLDSSSAVARVGTSDAQPAERAATKLVEA